MRAIAPLLTAAAIAVSPAYAADDFIEAAEKVAASIVSVISTNDAGTPAEVSAVTSGVIISSEGFVLASSHAVNGFDAISVRLADGTGHEAGVHGFDEIYGFALLKLAAGGLSPIEFADSEKLKVGQWVASVGNQFGIEKNPAPSFSVGIVGALNCSLPSIACKQLIKTDAVMNAGCVGGPLIDTAGRAVGINMAICSMSGGWQGVGYAVPANQILSIIEDLKTGSKKQRGWLGVSIEYDSQVHVVGVIPNSPAAAAGMQVGDVILAFNGKPVTDSLELVSLVAACPPGSRATAAIMRDGRRSDIKIDVTAPPRSLSCIAPANMHEPDDGAQAQPHRLPDSDLSRDLAEAREKISHLIENYADKLKDPKLAETYRKAFRDISNLDLRIINPRQLNELRRENAELRRRIEQLEKQINQR